MIEDPTEDYAMNKPAPVTAEEKTDENPVNGNAVVGQIAFQEIAPAASESIEDAIDAPGDLVRAKLILEAALLSSSEPLQLVDLKKLFEQELSTDTIRKLLDDLKADWSNRAVELCPVASGWRFRVKPEFGQFVQRMNPEKPPRYSRAVMETLAIIAYRQPATRGDIEQIRGVTVSTQIIKTLEERGWIEAIGHREVAGRPALYATTKRFLDDLNLRTLEELPSLDELQSVLNLTPSDATPAGEEASSPPEQEAVDTPVDAPIVEAEIEAASGETTPEAASKAGSEVASETGSEVTSEASSEVPFQATSEPTQIPNNTDTTVHVPEETNAISSAPEEPPTEK